MTPIECTVSKDAPNGFRIVGKVVRVADAGLCWRARVYVSGTPTAHWHSDDYDDAVAWLERMVDAYVEAHSEPEPLETNNDECEAIEIDGPPDGEPMGRCSCGRPLYRSAGTTYHSTDD